MLGQLSDVRSQQVSLGGQMGVLQVQLDKANQLSVARAGDTKVGRTACAAIALAATRSASCGQLRAHANCTVHQSSPLMLSWPHPLPPQLLDLVAASRADIATGQAALVSRLDALLQKQQAALEAAASAAKALAAIQDLQGQQSKALAALEKAVQNQLYAIKVGG